MNCEYCQSRIFENDRTCPRYGAPNKFVEKQIKYSLNPLYNAPPIWDSGNHYKMHFNISASTIDGVGWQPD